MMKKATVAEVTAMISPNPLMLVCTQKKNGRLNMAPVSFFMYVSFDPPMVSFAMMRESNTEANFRRTQKAVIALPGISIKDAVMAYGSVSGSKVDKLEETPIPLAGMEGTDIQFPEDSKVALAVTLERTVVAGDHYLYTCRIDHMVADEEREGLFAWNGYSLAAPATVKE